MGLPSNTLTTFTAIGNREDLSDIVYDVSPAETPFLSALPKTKATGTKHEWQTHALTAPSGSNAVLEGDDATTDAATVNARVYNYRQISDKVARVTGTQEAVDNAGKKAKMAAQMEARMKELKTDVETTLLANVASVAGNATLAPRSAGLQAWVKTNIARVAGRERFGACLGKWRQTYAGHPERFPEAPVCIVHWIIHQNERRRQKEGGQLGGHLH